MRSSFDRYKTMTTWKFTAITSWEEVLTEDFWAQWDEWYSRARSPHVFISTPLIRAWLDTYLPIRNLRPVYIVAESDANIVFQPFVLWTRSWKHAGQRMLAPVGHADYDYHDPIAVVRSGPIDWASYWPQLLTFLGRYREFRWDSLTIDGLRASCADQSGSGIVAYEQCPFVHLGGLSSGDDYLEIVKKKVRQEFRRKWDRLKLIGPTKVACFGQGHLSEALAALPEFLKHHSLRWPNAYRAPGFHERVLRNGINAGAAILQVLLLNDRAIAWNLNLIDSDTLRYYIPAYDCQWREYSPGHILRFNAIQFAIQHRLNEVDFLRGAEEYKDRWATGSHSLYQVSARSDSLSSRARSWVADKTQDVARYARRW